MHVEDKKRYIARAKERFERYGYDPRSVGWRKGRQHLRWHILTSIADLQGCSILDLGCGFADLYDYLAEHGWRGEYVGYDIVPSIVEVAREHHPHLDVQGLDILEDPVERRFDYVLAAGTLWFETLYEDQLVYLERMLSKMFELADKGVASDFVSSYVDWEQPDILHVDPAWVLTAAKKLSRRVTLRHDYMPFEFAVYIYKDQDFNPEIPVFHDFLPWVSPTFDGQPDREKVG